MVDELVNTRYVRSSTQKARTLRRNQTPEEEILWKTLRNRFLTVKFRRQWSIGGYLVDFVCFERNLIIELDGPQHAEENAAAYDAVRTEFLEVSGFKVIRFWNSQIETNLDTVLHTIQQSLS